MNKQNRNDIKWVYVTNDDPNDKGIWSVPMERYKQTRRDKETPIWYLINHEQACEISGSDPEKLKNFDHNLEFNTVNPKLSGIDEEDVMILGGAVEEEAESEEDKEDELDPNMYSKKGKTTRKKKPVVVKSALD